MFTAGENIIKSLGIRTKLNENPEFLFFLGNSIERYVGTTNLNYKEIMHGTKIINDRGDILNISWDGDLVRLTSFNKDQSGNKHSEFTTIKFAKNSDMIIENTVCNALKKDDGLLSMTIYDNILRYSKQGVLIQDEIRLYQNMQFNNNIDTLHFGTMMTLKDHMKRVQKPEIIKTITRDPRFPTICRVQKYEYRDNCKLVQDQFCSLNPRYGLSKLRPETTQEYVMPQTEEDKIYLSFLKINPELRDMTYIEEFIKNTENIKTLEIYTKELEIIKQRIQAKKAGENEGINNRR